MVLISALSPNFLAIAAIPGKFLSGMFLGQHKHQGDLFFFFFLVAASTTFSLRFMLRLAFVFAQ